jgi:hypothetical protein
VFTPYPENARPQPSPRPSASISGLRFGAGLPVTVRMLAKACSAAVSGIEAYPVEVEVNAVYGDTLIVSLSCILRASRLSVIQFKV